MVYCACVLFKLPVPTTNTSDTKVLYRLCTQPGNSRAIGCHSRANVSLLPPTCQNRQAAAHKTHGPRHQESHVRINTRNHSPHRNPTRPRGRGSSRTILAQDIALRTGRSPQQEPPLQSPESRTPPRPCCRASCPHRTPSCRALPSTDACRTSSPSFSRFSERNRR